MRTHLRKARDHIVRIARLREAFYPQVDLSPIGRPRRRRRPGRDRAEPGAELPGVRAGRDGIASSTADRMGFRRFPRTDNDTGCSSPFFSMEVLRMAWVDGRKRGDGRTRRAGKHAVTLGALLLALVALAGTAWAQGEPR